MTKIINNYSNLKKGAMFGLDARIALAIFGALSVISGAALYSAIQNSKATSLLADMNEVAKAYEAFYLDTSVDLKRVGVISNYQDYSRRKADDLVVNNSYSNWKGPYIGFERHSSGFLDYPNYSYASILSTSDLDWGEGHATNANWYATNAQCSASIQCYLWVQITGINGNSTLHNKIDEIVDGADGAQKGSFRWYKPAADYTYMLKFMPVKY